MSTNLHCQEVALLLTPTKITLHCLYQKSNPARPKLAWRTTMKRYLQWIENTWGRKLREEHEGYCKRAIKVYHKLTFEAQ